MTVLYIMTVSATTMIQITKRTILPAKNKHAKPNDRHVFQFKLVPEENILRYMHHRNPRCSKFTERIWQKKSDSIENSIQSSNSVNKKN